MKKTLVPLIAIILLFFIVSMLYVFEVWPFNISGPIIKKTTEQVAPAPEELPDFLTEDGIERAKTYSEHISRATLLEINGYTTLAIAEYKAASDLSPTQPGPLIEMGRLYLEENDNLNAKLSFEAALEIKPENLKAKIYLVKALIADRKISEANDAVNSIQIHNQESKYYQGLLAAYFGDYDGSKNLLNESINIGTSADLVNKAKNFLSAYDEFYFNQGGQNTHLQTLLARSFNQAGEYQMAIPLLFQVVKDKKDYRDAWILLGYAYLNIEKYTDTVEALEEARKLDPEKAETAFYLGLAYQGLEDYGKAIAYFELAKTNGYEPLVQVEQKLAELYLKEREYGNAAQSYENMLALNDKDVYQFIKPIWIYLERLEQPSRAVVLANKALAAHPQNAMSYNLLGWAAIGAGNYTAAEEYLTKALAIDPNLDAIYLNFGVLSEKQKKYENATKYYKKAYELGKGNSISIAAGDNYNKLIGKLNKLDYSSGTANVLNSNN